MKRGFFLIAAAFIFPAAAAAQSADAVIERAVLAAPERMRADATVLDLRADGTIAVLREGSNGLICWDNAGRPGITNPIDVQCTTAANRDRLAQNHAIISAGENQEEIDARFAEAERNGTRALSEFGSIYYHVMGASPDALRTHTTVAVPNATAESLGLPAQPGPARLWLMDAGTSSAHLMVSGM